VIGGPTASGKSRIALQLACQLRAPIINADSRQFYRELTIGTAMPAPHTQRLVPHYLFGHRSIEAPAPTVKDYEQEVLNLLHRLFRRHRIAILVGGSGFFISAVLHGLDDIPTIPPNVRHHIHQLWQRHGLQFLQEEVARLDPDYYARVDRCNPRRLQRALEVIYHTGRPFSSFHHRQPAPRFFRYIYFGIYRPPESLKHRIRERLVGFWRRGQVEEARTALLSSSPIPRSTITYQELVPFFEGKCSLSEAFQRMQTHTWQYARRQMTWFRKYGPREWFTPDQHNLLTSRIRQVIEESHK